MTVANKPGVTMALKWANVHPQLDILDTPGLLWGRIEDHDVATKLALSGSIAEKVLPTEELAEAAFKFIMTNYPDALNQRYHYEGTNYEEFLETLAKNRGYVQNGELKLNESMSTFLREFRQGDLGPMSLE